MCHQCKSILYENPELVSPRDIIDKYDLKCPKCSTVLTFDPNRLSISVSNNDERKGIFRIFQKNP